MKCSIPAILSAAMAVATVAANPAIPQVEIHTYLVHEEVDITIAGDRAEVSGTYEFKNDSISYFDISIYLPVYAAKGTPQKEMKPTIRMGGKDLDVRFVEKRWEGSLPVADFGKLPQLEGQEVYWFLVPHVPQQPEKTEMTLEINYTQKLSKGKFIYTPLIPGMKKDHDYGSIKLSGERGLTLIDPDKHDYVAQDGKLVVEPAHKRAIVVELVMDGEKLP